MAETMEDKSEDSDMSISVIEEAGEIISPTKSTCTSTSPATHSRTKKKKGVFKKDWLYVKEYSLWLQEVKTDPIQARCKACLKTFSVHCDGKTALKKHMNSDIHKTCMKSFGISPSLTSITPSSTEAQKTAAVESTFVYHGVKHGHSYNSQQCTISLSKSLFESSSTVAKSLSCGRTKSRAIACNVLAPYFTLKIVDEVSRARFYSMSFDASNKGNTKTYPFAVQYFSEIGIKRGLIDFIDDSRETAVDIFNNAITIINDHQLDINNLTSIGADNANVNFGQYHSVFKLFKDRLPNIRKGNCYGHILHNGVKHAHDVLLIDIEIVLCKVYSHFSVSAKRVEQLKSYYDFVQIEYRVLLEHINIRWLSLLPSIKRLIENYQPLKLYFLEQKATKKESTRTANTFELLKCFFGDNEGLCTLHFLENVLVDVQRAELKLQRTYTTAIDLYGIITSLIRKLERRLSDNYYGSETHSILNQLKETDREKAKELQESFESFIKTFIEYINSYFNDDRQFYEKLSVFDCQSIHFLKWEYVLHVVELIKIDGLVVNELYDEHCEIKFLYDDMKRKNVDMNEQIKLYISSKTIGNSETTTDYRSDQCNIDENGESNLLAEGPNTNDVIRSDQLWSYLLNMKSNTTPNMRLVVAYVFSIPCSNAYVETIFSHMKHLWSDYRNRMDIELVAAELQIRKNANIPCMNFYNFIFSQHDLLKKISSNEKFMKKKRIADE